MKEIIEKNERANILSKDIEILKKYFPNCFDKNENFQMDKFQKRILEEIDITKEGYEMKWLGKSYGRLIANMETETLLIDDEEHNASKENRNSENLYIEGDNIDVLKHLKNAYGEKIKMIYMDPPYNTGSDGFVYKDDRKFTKEELSALANISEEEAERILSFNEKGSNSHSAWLTFMYPRLLVARELLSEDGAIFISIDDNEVSQLKLLCDEVFGEENFVSQISWRKTDNQANIGNFARVKEYILLYSKNKDYVRLNKMKLTDKAKKEYRYKDELGNFRRAILLHKTRGRYIYDIKTPTNRILSGPWMKDKEEFEKMKNENKIYWTKGGDEQPYGKIYLDENKGQIPNDFIGLEFGSNQEASLELEKLFGARYFDFPKSTTLLKYLINIGSDGNTIILDFFSGSATTAHAVMQLNVEDNGNRKYIMVQIPEKIDVKKSKVAYDFCKKIEQQPVISTIGKERIKRAANQIKKEFGDKSESLDLGFKLFKIKKIPEKYITRMKNDIDINGNILVTELLNREELRALLITWKTYDGYELTKDFDEIELVDKENRKYEGYKIDETVYFINIKMNTGHLVNLIEKFEKEKEFILKKIVLFGYHFSSDMLQTIRDMIITYKNKKNIELDLEVRY